MARTRNYLAALTTGYVVVIANLVVGLGMTPYTLKFLDAERYAIFALAADTLMWLSLLDLGFPTVLRSRLAQLFGKEDNTDASGQLERSASITFFVQSCLAGCAILLGIGMLWIFPKFFTIRPSLQGEVQTTLILLVIAQAISILTQTFSALLVAKQQQHIDNLIKLGLLLIRTVLTIVWLQEGWMLLSLACANLVATVLTSLFSAARCRRLFPSLRFRRAAITWEEIQKTGRVGIWFTLGSIAGILILQMDRIITAKLLSLPLVTTLLLSSRLFLVAQSLIDQITNSARPMLGQVIGKGSKEEILRIHRQISSFSTGLAIVTAVSLWASNGFFVTRWVGTGYYGGPWLDLACAFNLIVHCWILPYRALLTAKLDYIAQQSSARFLEGSINLALSFYLGKSFGLVGILLATAFAALVTSTWLLPYYVAKSFDVSLISLIKVDVIRALAALCLLAPLAWGAKLLGNSVSGYGSAIISFLLTFLSGLVIFWNVLIEASLKRRLSETPFGDMVLASKSKFTAKKI